ncbi:hypothetical protein C1O66_08960 [Paucibacter aquatile]|uniref:Beta-barrel porin 2 n=2 Tax=Kinneretia aquatilis TaxID=2070761 RepID=A0A2N8KW24_9BURK|nr:hypothetical protein C1O66_08960 [Paucibacter aquatile]
MPTESLIAGGLRASGTCLPSPAPTNAAPGSPRKPMSVSLNRPLPPAALGLLSLLGCCLASPALADANPYYVGTALNLSHVSNIYRQNNNANSDRVVSASLLAGIDQTFGRQRLNLDASLQANRYQNNSELNNRGYTLKGGLDWSTAERLSGSVKVNNSQSLATYNIGSGIAPIFKKNIEKNTAVDAVLRVGLVTKFSAEASAGQRSRRFSAVEYSRLEVDQTRYSLGLTYSPSPNLRLGVAGRHTRDRFPRFTLINLLNAEYQASEFTRKDIDLTGRAVLSGASSIDGRISHGRSRVKLGAGNDFNGTTGQLTWTWLPTVRWNIATTLSRDTGLETSFFRVGGNTLNADQNRVTTSAQLAVSYELTAKIVLNASASSSRAERVDDFLGQQAKSQDRDTAYSLGARWLYSRSIQLGCQYTKNSRSSTIVQYVYDANSFGCYGQMVLN